MRVPSLHSILAPTLILCACILLLAGRLDLPAFIETVAGAMAVAGGTQQLKHRN